MPVLIALFVLLAQPPAAAPKVEVTTLKAGLGSCSADFTVTAPDGSPVYDATIHVRVRYGFLGIKRADLEVGTNAEGAARIEGLPEKARLLMYDISKGDMKGTAEQDVSMECHAARDVRLK
jgi:hypothetical protein